jgi:hypothetical protein
MSKESLVIHRRLIGTDDVRRVTSAGLALGVALALGACAGSQSPGTGRTVTTLMIPKLEPAVVESKDFVKAQRPAGTDFIPITASAPERRMRAKTATEAAAAEAQLAGQARRHQGLRGEQEAVRRRTLANAPRPPRPQ